MAEFEKRAEYDAEARLENFMDLEEFREAIANSEYLEKCLACYNAGLRYCVHWELDSYCDNIDNLDTLDLIIEGLK